MRNDVFLTVNFQLGIVALKYPFRTVQKMYKFFIEMFKSSGVSKVANSTIFLKSKSAFGEIKSKINMLILRMDLSTSDL